MNLAELAIEKRAVTYFCVFLLVVGGTGSFFRLGWLEDPEFTVKTAAITVPYPGASAEEVELEVTDLIETKLQEMVEIKNIYSYSHPGLSVIKVEILPHYWADTLPQVWDVMRKKIGDVASELPPGAGPPVIRDDFGFVFGFLLGMTGEGFSDAELEEYAKELRKQMSIVPGVARVDLWGVQDKRIYVWYDAVIGYLSATKEWAALQGNPDAWRSWWTDPACRAYYFIGKDNIEFHAIIWPGMLIGYGQGLNLPYDVPSNEYLNVEGRKLSKSRRWMIQMSEVLNRYDPDPWRYAIAANFPETQDVNFTWEDFLRRNNDELVIVISGELTLVTDDGEEVLGPGDCVAFKAGVENAHHLQNRGSEPAVYYDIGGRDPWDVSTFPEMGLEAYTHQEIRFREIRGK